MRIRVPFAAAFFGLCLLSAYLGLSDLQLPINDKVLHFFAFFFLTLCFYWILEASRRRIINLTLIVCTAVGGVGSEFLQTIVNPKRKFDIFDIFANLVGSALSLLLCTWYHRRMMERKRLAKLYQPVPTDDGGDGGDNAGGGEELQDLEAGPPVPDEEPTRS